VSAEHRTVSRVTAILETAAASTAAGQGGVRLSALCAVLDAPKSSVHALVHGLVANGYLADADGDGYVLGPAAGALLATPQPPLVRLARPMLEQLRDEFDETVTLGRAVGDSMVYLDTAESRQVLRYSPPLRTRRPLYPTSTGKVALAHRPAARRAAHLAREFPDPGQRAAVEAELAAVRTDGVAYNRGETLPDVSAAACGVFAGARLVAGVAVAGPTNRTAHRLESVAARLKAATAQLSVRLSSAGP
jgi:DNA-binding IclR family transcriptional regulator